MNPLKRIRDRFKSLEIALSSLSSEQAMTREKLEGITDDQRQRFAQLEQDFYQLGKNLERIDANFSHQTLPHRSSEANILVAGFFGAFNLGDELILETTLSTLKATHPSARVTIMLADNYSSDITRYGDYDFIHYPNTPLEINAIARHFDAVIFPGGAIIDDVDYSLQKRPLTLGTIVVNLSLRFIAMDKPCILYGLSTNAELVNPEFIKKVDQIATKAQHFSLRDSNSLKTLESAGVTTDKITIVDDIVIANKLITQDITHNDHIGLIFIYTEDSFNKIVTFTQSILESTPNKTRLKLILFYDYENNDLTFAQKLVDTVNNPRLSIESASLGDYAATVKTIGSLATIFSMRYHGTLLANFLGKRVICLDYSQHRHYANKNQYLYSHYGFTKNTLDAEKLDTVSSTELSDILKSETKRIDSKTVQANASAQLITILKGIKTK